MAERVIPEQVRQRLLTTLTRQLGDAHVLTAPAEMAPYLSERRGLYQGQALAVARPGTTAEVAFVVEACREHGVPLVPQGGNTGLVGGAVPQGGLVVALARLNRIRQVDPVNFTITVEAGCILQAVQEAADQVDRLFPLALAAQGSCQIGGNLATNAGGTNVLHYGNARDLVLGLEVVLADGRVWNGLSGLRKDNTGYDLKHLFLGSEGTLGIITAAVLKLFPKPRQRQVAFVGCRGAHQVLELFARLRAAAGDVLTGFEYMSAFSLELVARHIPGARRPLAGEHGAYALIELSSPDPAADLGGRLEAVLGRALEDGVIVDATLAASEAQGQALWRLRESVPEAQTREGGSIKHDVSVPVSRVAEFIERASAACEQALPGIRVCAFGHVGDGNIHFNLTQPTGMEKQAFLRQWGAFNRLVHDIAVAMGGSISAEHGIGLLKREELRRYKDPVALDLMRTLKQALDPQGLLNPGKVLPPAD
ncbi:MAG: FAD-binding oxidoreductase [Xanthomonadaceae bacterium]|nr:FAD-binding oxidoreductase [Xanthomonadaceae bacterium]